MNFCDDVNCGDDFYNYVNYNWIEETQIPDGHSKWSVFQIIHHDNLNRINKLLELANKSPNKNYNKLFIIYSQFLNFTERSNPSNIRYIQQMFEKINLCSTYAELFNLMYEYDLLLNISFPLNIYIQSNFKDANDVILHIGSGGLSLPDRDYYLDESKKKIINKYKTFIREYSKLFGFFVDPEIIFNIEKKLAEKTYTKVQKRIPELSDNLSDWKSILESFPNLIFIERIFKKAKKEPGKINITNPEYLRFLNDFIQSNDLYNWKQYFCFSIMLTFHNCLNKVIELTYFNFYSGVLSGIKKMKIDWIRSIEFTESLLGQILGQLYVENYFNHESKNKVIQMVNYIKEELRLILINNDWMAKETKNKAIEKLNKINVKIGYPYIYL